jgi:hypothetical protein
VAMAGNSFECNLIHCTALGNKMMNRRVLYLVKYETVKLNIVCAVH